MAKLLKTWTDNQTLCRCWNGLSCAPRFWKGRSVSKYAICAYWEECVHSLLYQKYVKYELSNSDKKFLKGHLAYTRFCHDERRCVFKSYSAIQRSLNADVKTNIATRACFDSRTDDSNEPVLFMNRSNRRIRLLIWTRLANLTELKLIKFARLKHMTHYNNGTVPFRQVHIFMITFDSLTELQSLRQCIDTSIIFF